MPIHESSENYLKAILTLEREYGYVRAVDVASLMDVSKPSVSKAVGVLKDAECITLVNRDIRLTPRGREIAEAMLKRRDFFYSLLKSAGIDDDTAAEEACRMEHCLCDDSFEKLAALCEKTGAVRDGKESARF